MDRPNSATMTDWIALARAIIQAQHGDVYRFPLRRDFEAKVWLPKNLTHAEVARLTEWIAAMALPDKALGIEQKDASDGR